MLKLKDKISNAPVLALPIFEEPCIVETGASNKGLGAVLSQRRDGAIQLIAFASRALNTGERVEANYSSKKLECLAVVWNPHTLVITSPITGHFLFPKTVICFVAEF